MSVETVGVAAAAHLPAVREQIAAASPSKIARVAWRVHEYGYDEVTREDLSMHYKRHGLRELARQVRSGPPHRAVVVIEAGDDASDPRTRVLYCDPTRARE